nr:immunoglobulin light chain junction region [Macaca mulatta]MPN85281.1 immunoglobulin light chain junction region [Macaca mulatta]MPN85405.1 immunoglobulin light chain junction region [Macaca mulatta]MPN85526.1 immunoglobulin light chain junction region [Macaca mulatta]MPN85552.1 immunoglobulin light chain junction region [Macaca mulatta]
CAAWDDSLSGYIF